MVRRIAGGLLLIASFALTAPRASSAHALLMESSPKAGHVVPPPGRLVLRFNSRIEHGLSSIALVGPGQARVALDRPEAGGSDVLVYRLPGLAPGAYQARWEVFSADGHVTEGALAFHVSAEPRLIDLGIVKKALPRAQRLVGVRQGDEVVLRFTTDQPVSIHVHGYDIERTLAPGPPASVAFTARATGRFAITVHGDHAAPEVTLGYLEVHAR